MQLRRASLLVVLALGGAARAEDTFTAKTQVYADSDHTVVVSPLVAITKDAWRGGTLGATYVTDVVSSASTDVVSNATRHMSDVRYEIAGSVVQRWRDTTFTGAYVFSTENDYTSHGARLGVAQDLFQHNTTLGLSWFLSADSISRADDQAFHRSLLVNGLNISWTQTLTPKLVGELTYSFTYNDGYQASPYRFVPVATTDAFNIAFKVPETLPNIRSRHAAVIALSQHLFRDTVLQGDYRFYADGWGLIAHTVQLRYLLHFRAFTFRVRERIYYQRSADFYKPRYDQVEPYMTTDREASTLLSNLCGLKVTWRRPIGKRALELEAKGDFLYIHYFNYPLLAHRFGGTAELGINVEY